ncbi:hexose transporter [Fusarium heterosporum]|uniref:Hexose transporter n=1 Tax=Fusarium heterosporum TaxID=42747 RepID=A0A8H5SRT9_FUSHE|nr:hexose transporter [Fusarium heterosporum]
MGIKDIIGLGVDEKTKKLRDEAPKFEHVTWYKDPGLRTLCFYACVLCVSSMGTGWDGMYMGVVQNFDSWNKFFDTPTGSRLGLLTALYQIGSVASIPLVPMIADRWGRRYSIGLGFIIMAIGSGLQAGAPNYAVYSGGRVLLGFGNSFSQIASPMLLAELCHPQHRARFTTVYNCLWNMGSLLVSWTCFGTSYWGNDWSWRFPAIIQGAPGLIQLVILFWIPESPRFLIANDRQDEALGILAKYHANGNENHPTVQFQYREIRDTIKAEQLANNSSRYTDFLKTKGNRYRLIVLFSLGLFSQWSGNGVVSNYSARLYINAGLESENERLIITAGKTILDMVVSISCALLVERLNRRFSFLFATGGMFLTLVFWTLTCGLFEQHQAPGANNAMIFLVWLHGVFYSTCWSGLLIGYAVEILPYSLRAKGLMFLNISVQIALLLNNYLNPLAFEAWENADKTTLYGGNTWRLYLIYTIWVLGEVVFIYFMYVETRGPTLEEVAKVIDGEDAAVADVSLDAVEKEVLNDEHAERVSSVDGKEVHEVAPTKV